MRRLPCLLAVLLACDDSSSERDDASTARDASHVEDATTRDASAFDATVDRAPDASKASAPSWRLPPANGGLDYQLGGAYALPSGVSIVARDRSEAPAPGAYSICYVNGFQAQESEATRWLADHPALLLRDDRGQPVIDRDWNEMLLDIGSAEKRTELAAIIGAWIAGCARAGFDAVEIDNLDSYTRSGDRLREDDAVQFLALLSARAHAEGIAIGQKNASELAGRRRELGTDFVVAEECSRYDECDAYITSYGTAVLMIEYGRADFERGCSRHPDFSIVLRDLALVPAGRAGYVFEGC